MTDRAMKIMRLRYPGSCRSCGADLSAGTKAIYDRASRKITCLTCVESARSGGPPVAALGPVAGVAGASARREYERRMARREAHIRALHPRLAGLLLRLSAEPQSTTAWKAGARGEEILARRLEHLTANGVHLLHDRRIPGTKANIDHMAVTPGGVCVIDAKRYKGRPHLRVDGGLFRPRTTKLLVGTRNCTNLVIGLHKQMALVRAALDRSNAQHVPVRGMLCFVEGDWPLIGGAFMIDGLHVLWPKKAAEYLNEPGPLTGEFVEAVHRSLAAAFPPA
jgi:hypothetical protein